MSVNDITGDKIVTEPASEKYRSGWDRIFGKPQSPSVEDAIFGRVRLQAGDVEPITQEKIDEFIQALAKYETVPDTSKWPVDLTDSGYDYEDDCDPYCTICNPSACEDEHV